MRARVKVDPDRQIGVINRNVYGQFMCRRPGCSEGGLYDPDAVTADEHGIRSDVKRYLQDLRPPLIRWPGGCTGTSYHWMDGVGPIEERPSKIDLHFGWPARYEFGTHEFIRFCRSIGAEPHLNLAMGTADLDEAAAWVEYCNGKHNTYYANLRRRHGQEDPFNVRYWQMGNENYGPWEIGYTSARDYGVTAREWAKTLRRLDREMQLIAVGGGVGFTPEWAWDVMPEVCPYVDYLSLHDYWRATPNPEDWYPLMAGPHRAGQVIEEMAAVIRHVRRRNPLSRNVKIAVTEWNAAIVGGMMTHHPEYNPFGPTYRLRDALAVASFVNILQRHCREVTLATVAQSINVVGLVMVTPDGAWREPIYWPFWMQVNHSGPVALDAWVDCDAFSEHEMRMDAIPYLDASATFDPQSGTLFLSLVNQHRDDSIELQVDIDAEISESGNLIRLFHDDAMAMNSPAEPDNVYPTQELLSGLGRSFTLELPPHSYTIAEVSCIRA